MTAIPSGTKFVGISASVDTTERRSSQANGKTEIYTIDDIVAEAQSGLPAAPTTTTVNISSAQILAMGDTPIELLPAPGVGKYYDIEKIVLEPIDGATPYTNNEDIYITDGSTVGYTNRYALNTLPSIIRNFSQFVRTEAFWGGNVVISDQLQINQPITMTTDGATNPTLGDGTLRAIITYTTRTFGA